MRNAGCQITHHLFALMLLSTGVIAATAREQPATEGLPLEPERKIEFTTDEGTWISLDVSRDGKTILFELQGDSE